MPEKSPIVPPITDIWVSTVFFTSLKMIPIHHDTQQYLYIYIDTNIYCFKKWRHSCWSHRRWPCQSRFAPAEEVHNPLIGLHYKTSWVIACRHVFSQIYIYNISKDHQQLFLGSLKFVADGLKTRFLEYFVFHWLYSLVRSSRREKSLPEVSSGISFWTSP